MLRHIRLLLLAHVLSIFLIGSVHAVCPAGDFNGDCHVDFLDLQIFTEQWLEPSGSGDQINYADLDGAVGCESGGGGEQGGHQQAGEQFGRHGLVPP